eukprot:9491474-Pyramimonas_sp.AAC.1
MGREPIRGLLRFERETRGRPTSKVPLALDDFGDPETFAGTGRERNGQLSPAGKGFDRGAS